MNRSLYQVPYFELTCAAKHELPLGSLTGVTYLRYTVLTSSNKSETAVHCCDPALPVLVMLVSRNVFHVVAALQTTVFYTFFWLIRDSTLAAFIVWGPLHLVSHFQSQGIFSFLTGWIQIFSRASHMGVPSSPPHPTGVSYAWMIIHQENYSEIHLLIGLLI